MKWSDNRAVMWSLVGRFFFLILQFSGRGFKGILFFNHILIGENKNKKFELGELLSK